MPRLVSFILLQVGMLKGIRSLQEVPLSDLRQVPRRLRQGMYFRVLVYLGVCLVLVWVMGILDLRSPHVTLATCRN